MAIDIAARAGLGGYDPAAVLAERGPFRRQLTAAVIERQERIAAERIEALGRIVGAHVADVVARMLR